MSGEAVAAGVSLVQYRAKDESLRAMLAEALELKQLCRGARFVVNDRVEVALAVDADGVHLGQDDLPCDAARRLLGPGKIIGVTVAAWRKPGPRPARGPITWGFPPFSPPAPSPTPARPPAWPSSGTSEKPCPCRWRPSAASLWQNCPEVIAAGADLVCAISAVVTGADVRGEIEKFQRLFGDSSQQSVTSNQ
jgi:thiamine-phosphate pyrophosphorylase